MNGLLSELVNLARVGNVVAAGTGDTQSSSIVDMAGYDGVLFVAILGDVTTGAVVTLQAQQNTANQATGMATLAGTSAQAAAGAADQDNKILVLDVFKPMERYLRAQIVRATANVAIDGILAIRYRGRTAPVVQDSSVLSAVRLVSPVEA